MPRRAAWWLIGMLLVIDTAASGWLWLLWMERQARRDALHPGQAGPVQRHAATSSAAALTQRMR